MEYAAYGILSPTAHVEQLPCKRTAAGRAARHPRCKQVKQDLAEASDAQEINFLRKRVESMDKHFASLREEDNMLLLRDQLGGEYKFLLSPQA